MRIKAAVFSEKGKIRNINQDNFCIFNKINQDNSNACRYSNLFPRNNEIFAVFDGMGGEQSGEVASMLAAKIFLNNKKNIENDFDKFIKTYIEEANKKLCEYMEEKDDLTMGTTAAILQVDTGAKKAYAANVGDSKIYFIRNGEVTVLTQDHNIPGELYRMGIIENHEIFTHKDKNKLTQYIGIFDDDILIEPYIAEDVDIQTDDIFIICSDGLTDGVYPDDFNEIISTENAPSRIAEKLVNKAMQNGSRDNITVLVVKIV